MAAGTRPSLVRARHTRIIPGLDLIRRALWSADGRVRLLVDPRCVRLIEALEGYHYPEPPLPPSEQPVKDGVFDHPIDALRYLFPWRESPGFQRRRY